MLPTIEDFSNPTWWNENTKYAVKSVSNDSMDGAGGLSATMQRFTIVLDNDEKKSVILKAILPGNTGSSVPLGLAREPIFIQEFSSTLSSHLQIPTCFYGYGDMESGVKYLLVEDLAPLGYIQAGYFFGPGSPLNWGKDLPTLTAPLQDSVDQIAISKVAFESIAYLHASHWVSNSSTDKETSFPSYLRGSDWPLGKGKEQWLGSQNFAISSWEAKSSRQLNWNPRLLELIEASLAKIDWDVYQASLRDDVFTIIHGDFHPANCLVANNDSNIKLAVVDWELCGVGSGPQDIAQFLISHMNPSERKVAEKDLLTAYHNALIKHGVKDYSFEKAWNDYILGGTGKWIWLVCVMTGMPSIPDNLMQYFQDQLADFVITHNVTVENVPMTRA